MEEPVGQGRERSPAGPASRAPVAAQLSTDDGPEVRPRTPVAAAAHAGGAAVAGPAAAHPAVAAGHTASGSRGHGAVEAPSDGKGAGRRPGGKGAGGGGGQSTAPPAIHCLTQYDVSKAIFRVPLNVVAVLFPGLWRRLHTHLDAGVQVRANHLPVTLVLASLPEDDPGREVQMYLSVQAPRSCFDRNARSKNMRVHLCPSDGELQPRKGEAGAGATGGYPSGTAGGAGPLTGAAGGGAGAGVAAACGTAPGAGAFAASTRQKGASPTGKYSFADAVQRLGLRQGSDIVLRRRSSGQEGGAGGGGGLGGSGSGSGSGSAGRQAAAGGGLHARAARHVAREVLRDKQAVAKAGRTEAPTVPTVRLEGGPKVLELLPLRDVPPEVAESLRAAAAAAYTAARRADMAHLVASNVTAPASQSASPLIRGMPAGGVPSAAAQRVQSREPAVRGQTRAIPLTTAQKEKCSSPENCAERVAADKRGAEAQGRSHCNRGPAPAAGSGTERLAADAAASTAAVGALGSGAAGRGGGRSVSRGGGEGGSAGGGEGPAAGGLRDTGGTPAPAPKRRRPLHGGWILVGSESIAAAAATQHDGEARGQQQQKKEGEQVGLPVKRAVERLQQQQQSERRGMALAGPARCDLLLPQLHAQGPEPRPTRGQGEGQRQEPGEGRGEGQGMRHGNGQAGRHMEEEGDGRGTPHGKRQGQGTWHQRQLGTGPAGNAAAGTADAGVGSATLSAPFEVTPTGVQHSAIMLTARSAAGLFPGLWGRLQAHLDAGVQVRSRSLPVTLVLASLPEDDPGREVQGHIRLYNHCADSGTGKAIVIYLPAGQAGVDLAFQRTGLTLGSRFLLRRPLCGTHTGAEAGEGGSGAAAGGPRGDDHGAFAMLGSWEASREVWAKESKVDSKTGNTYTVTTVWWEGRPVAAELPPLHSGSPQGESAQQAGMETAGGGSSLPTPHDVPPNTTHPHPFQPQPPAPVEAPVDAIVNPLGLTSGPAGQVAHLHTPRIQIGAELQTPQQHEPSNPPPGAGAALTAPQQQPQPPREGPSHHGVAGGGPGAGPGPCWHLAAAAAAGASTGAGMGSKEFYSGLSALDTLGPSAYHLDAGAHTDAAGAEADAVTGPDTDGTYVRADAFGPLPAGLYAGAADCPWPLYDTHAAHGRGACPDPKPDPDPGPAAPLHGPLWAHGAGGGEAAARGGDATGYPHELAEPLNSPRQQQRPPSPSPRPPTPLPVPPPPAQPFHQLPLLQPTPAPQPIATHRAASNTSGAGAAPLGPTSGPTGTEPRLRAPGEPCPAASPHGSAAVQVTPQPHKRLRLRLSCGAAGTGPSPRQRGSGGGEPGAGGEREGKDVDNEGEHMGANGSPTAARPIKDHEMQGMEVAAPPHGGSPGAPSEGGGAAGRGGHVGMGMGAGGGEAVMLQGGRETPASAEAPLGLGLPRTPRGNGQYCRRQGGAEVGPHAAGGDQGAHGKHGQLQHLGRRVREFDDAGGAGPSTGTLEKRQRRCSPEGEQGNEARSDGTPDKEQSRRWQEASPPPLQPPPPPLQPPLPPPLQQHQHQQGQAHHQKQQEDPCISAMGGALKTLAASKAALGRAQADNGELRQLLRAAQALAEWQAVQVAEADASARGLQQQCGEVRSWLGERTRQLQEAKALVSYRSQQLAEAVAGKEELRQRCGQLSACVAQQARRLAEGEAERGRLAEALQREAEGAAMLMAEAEEYRGRYGRMVELLRQSGFLPEM